MLSHKATVIIADDSLVLRGIISRALREAPDIETVRTVSDGDAAIRYAGELKPDIVLLDIEMPRKNGLEALQEILEVSPQTRVMMVSSLTHRNADISMRALALGAADYVAKPEAGEHDAFGRFAEELLTKIRTLIAAARRGRQESRSPAAAQQEGPLTSQALAPSPPVSPSYPAHPPRALAIAASTGGPQALTTLFAGLKQALPAAPIFVTQHMPPTFTQILAKNLGTISEKTAHEARSGMKVEAGHIYVAPGDFHMRITRVMQGVSVQLDQGPAVNYCRPAADPMIESLLPIYDSRLLLLVLTGMGQDGLEGARKLVALGGTVVAQDKESSVVWGMPRAVVQEELASAVLPLDAIANYVTRAFRGKP